MEKLIKAIFKIFTSNEKIPLLGRWCHVNVPHCNNNVILKKIDFANSDNNFSYKNKLHINNYSYKKR